MARDAQIPQGAADVGFRTALSTHFLTAELKRRSGNARHWKRWRAFSLRPGMSFSPEGGAF